MICYILFTFYTVWSHWSYLKIFRIKCIHVPFPNIRFIVSILGLRCAGIVPFLSRMITIVYCVQLFPSGMAGHNQHLEVWI